MPRHTTTTKIKKEAKTIKKSVEKKTPVRKSVARTSAVSSSVKAKKTDSNFNILNIVAILGLLIVLGLVVFSLDRYNSSRQKLPAPVISVPAVTYDCAEGKTALAVLQDTAEAKTQESTLGLYVDTINNTQNKDGNFWIFYVNGQIANAGPDQYTCQAGDKVEWRYEKIM